MARTRAEEEEGVVDGERGRLFGGLGVVVVVLFVSLLLRFDFCGVLCRLEGVALPEVV